MQDRGARVGDCPCRPLPRGARVYQIFYVLIVLILTKNYNNRTCQVAFCFISIFFYAIFIVQENRIVSKSQKWEFCLISVFFHPPKHNLWFLVPSAVHVSSWSTVEHFPDILPELILILVWGFLKYDGFCRIRHETIQIPS